MRPRKDKGPMFQLSACSLLRAENAEAQSNPTITTVSQGHASPSSTVDVVETPTALRLLLNVSRCACGMGIATLRLLSFLCKAVDLFKPLQVTFSKFLLF
mmetsp:Transcript_15428/g.43938  ORF Transcript_15428/g.43938 Transcript_15428/m.43938 type:complete len:100 (-) Transcript_15428:474-773(-)